MGIDSFRHGLPDSMYKLPNTSKTIKNPQKANGTFFKSSLVSMKSCSPHSYISVIGSFKKVLTFPLALAEKSCHLAVALVPPSDNSVQMFIEGCMYKCTNVDLLSCKGKKFLKIQKQITYLEWHVLEIEDS